MQISPLHSRLRRHSAPAVRHGNCKAQGWMKVKQEYSTLLRVVAGSEICCSDCSLTSELQKLLVGDLFPHAGAYF